jgi:hypothetical protein
MTRLAYVMSTSFVVLAIAGRSSVSITPKLDLECIGKCANRPLHAAGGG